MSEEMELIVHSLVFAALAGVGLFLAIRPDDPMSRLFTVSFWLGLIIAFALVKVFVFIFRDTEEEE